MTEIKSSDKLSDLDYTSNDHTPNNLDIDQASGTSYQNAILINLGNYSMTLTDQMRSIWLKYNFTANYTYELTLYQYDVFLNMEVFDTSGKFYRGITNNTSPKVSYLGSLNGTYYINVFQIGPTYNFGDFTLNLSHVNYTFPESPSIPQETIDLSIGNNEDTSNDTSYSIWYLLNMTSDQEWYIQMNSPSSSYDIQIYDQDMFPLSYDSVPTLSDSILLGNINPTMYINITIHENQTSYILSLERIIDISPVFPMYYVWSEIHQWGDFYNFEYTDYKIQGRTVTTPPEWYLEIVDGTVMSIQFMIDSPRLLIDNVNDESFSLFRFFHVYLNGQLKQPTISQWQVDYYDFSLYLQPYTPPKYIEYSNGTVINYYDTIISGFSSTDNTVNIEDNVLTITSSTLDTYRQRKIDLEIPMLKYISIKSYDLTLKVTRGDNNVSLPALKYNQEINVGDSMLWDIVTHRENGEIDDSDFSTYKEGKTIIISILENVSNIDLYSFTFNDIDEYLEIQVQNGEFQDYQYSSYMKLLFLPTIFSYGNGSDINFFELKDKQNKTVFPKYINIQVNNSIEDGIYTEIAYRETEDELNVYKYDINTGFLISYEMNSPDEQLVIEFTSSSTGNVKSVPDIDPALPENTDLYRVNYSFTYILASLIILGVLLNRQFK